jgi:hypothetical protein
MNWYGEPCGCTGQPTTAAILTSLKCYTTNSACSIGMFLSRGMRSHLQSRSDMYSHVLGVTTDGELIGEWIY